MAQQVKVKHIGFTGTRKGMTDEQKRSFKKGLIAIKKNAKLAGQHVYFHHGACVGADQDACDIAVKMGFLIAVHPPSNKSYVFDYADTATVIFDEKPYLNRNKDIVDACSAMFCCPGEEIEQRRSGTWSTIRYADKTNTKRMIIYPDGSYVLAPKK